MSQTIGLDMIITYAFANHPNVAFPHFLEVETTNNTHIMMVRTEYLVLCELVKAHIDPDDFQFDDVCKTVSFRNKADALRIKLMWNPIEWKQVGPSGW